jgi:hypothetical protein
MRTLPSASTSPVFLFTEALSAVSTALPWL